MDAYARLKELGLRLPEVPEPRGMFQPVTQVGNLVYLSGQGSYSGDTWVTGKVGAITTLEEAQQAIDEIDASGEHMNPIAQILSAQTTGEEDE